MNSPAITSINERPLAHNVELEQQILGNVLSDNDLFYKISDIVKSDHFYDPVHARIWKSVGGRIVKKHLASPVTLKVDLEADEGLKEIGGPAYLARLVGGAMSSYAIRDYAEELVEIAQKRALQQDLYDAQDKLSEGKSTVEIKAGLSLSLTDFEKEGQESSINLVKAFTTTLERMNEGYHGDKPQGIQTGIGKLDERLGGLFSPDLIVLGGRPSMGKTALATSIVLRVAKQGIPVAAVSLEMDGVGISHRLIAELSGVPYFDFRQAHKMTEGSYRKAVDAVRENMDLPIEIVPPGVREIGSIYSSLYKINHKFKPLGGIGLVVVDYLQLVRARGNSRTEEIGNVSQGLKNIAQMLGCPVLALSQLSRGVEMRDNKRPMMSDLRESGQIEQDADVVMFCYRDAYYLERQKPAEDDVEKTAAWQADLEASRGFMEVITAKQRMGSIGSDMIGCNIATNQFWNLEQQAEVEF